MLAAVVPHLGLVISLCGSFNAPMLSIILPPVFALRHLPSRGAAFTLLHTLIFVIGVGGCVLGTRESVHRILIAGDDNSGAAKPAGGSSSMAGGQEEVVWAPGVPDVVLWGGT